MPGPHTALYRCLYCARRCERVLDKGTSAAALVRHLRVQSDVCARHAGPTGEGVATTGEGDAALSTTVPLKAPYPYFGGKSRAAASSGPHSGMCQTLWTHSWGPWRSCSDDQRRHSSKPSTTGTAWCQIFGVPCSMILMPWPTMPTGLVTKTICTRDMPGSCHNARPSRHVWRATLTTTTPKLPGGGAGACAAGLAPAGAAATAPGRWSTASSRHLGNAGQGVQRQRTHLGNAGQGVQRKRTHLGGARGTGEQGIMAARNDGIYTWMRALCDRLRYVRVTCGDWTRVLGPSVTWKHGLTGVVLDPPYSHSERTKDLYARRSGHCPGGAGVVSGQRGQSALAGGALRVRVGIRLAGLALRAVEGDRRLQRAEPGPR